MILKNALEKLNSLDDSIEVIKQEQDRIKTNVINSDVCPYSVGDVVVNDFKWCFAHQGKKVCITSVTLRKEFSGRWEWHLTAAVLKVNGNPGKHTVSFDVPIR